ncbi:MAG: RagB/SusD family nutrient uptake outer membrane protein [Lutibacter sp.]
MKNILKKLGIIIFVFSLASCSDDYLDTLPTDSVGAAEAIATTKNAWASLNGIHRTLYSQMRSTQGEGGLGGVFLVSEHLGDDLVYASSSVNTSWYSGAYRWVDHRNENSTVDSYPYYYFYNIINNANLIIAQIDNAVGDPAEKNAIKGQALAYRGWAHFNLVQLYGKRYVRGAVNSQLGVPILLTSTTEGLARNTVEEVYTQINVDLNDAATLLTGYSRPNKSHLNLNVVNGLRARVALTQGRWTDAATHAANAKTGFSLMTTSQYQGGFNDINNSEWMWGSSILDDQTMYFYSIHAYISRNFSSSHIRTHAKVVYNNLYTKFPSTDIRRGVVATTNSTADNYPSYMTFAGGVTYARAAGASNKFWVKNPSSSVADIVNMRVSEMWLIEAEARARNSEDVLAQNALHSLNLIRRSDVPLKSTNVGAALIDEIMLHRRMELWGEGFRFFDLKRTNAALKRDHTGTNHLQSQTNGLFNVPAGDMQWEFMIPRAELNANPLMVQNPS